MKFEMTQVEHRGPTRPPDRIPVYAITIFFAVLLAGFFAVTQLSCFPMDNSKPACPMWFPATNLIICWCSTASCSITISNSRMTISEPKSA